MRFDESEDQMRMIGHHHGTIQVNAIPSAVANRGEHDVTCKR
jgi:hypothetical protein